MRELKFRAWHPVWKRFIYFSGLNLITHNLNYFLEAEEANCRTCFHCFKSEEVVIHQWTGLKDGQGRNIYEGDLCKVSVAKWDSATRKQYLEYEIIEIAWNVETARFWGKDLKQTHYACGWDFHEGLAPKLTVVGTVLENPELCAS